MASNNTMSIEDVINTVDARYQFSLYLKLRGHIAYKASKLAGQYMAKRAKGFYDNRQELGIDTFAQAMAYVRGEQDEASIMEESGMAVSTTQDMFNTLRRLVEYSNKLNFDMQELIDPTDERRHEPGFVQRGVFFDEAQQRDSWVNSVKLLAEGDEDKLTETYAEYIAAVPDKRFALTEQEWTNANAAEDNLWETYADDIVELLMDFGDEECEFDDLDLRSQIGAIENMRGKIPACIESCLKSVKYNRELDSRGKVAEATKLKGLINGFNQLFMDMLDSSRYANHHEYMYNYMPQREGAVVAKTVSRKMKAKREADENKAPARVSDKVAESINASIEEMESDI